VAVRAVPLPAPLLTPRPLPPSEPSPSVIPEPVLPVSTVPLARPLLALELGPLPAQLCKPAASPWRSEAAAASGTLSREGPPERLFSPSASPTALLAPRTSEAVSSVIPSVDSDGGEVLAGHSRQLSGMAKFREDGRLLFG